MEQQTIFTCVGGKKEKEGHTSFYNCVSGPLHWDKVKLYPATNVIKMMRIEKYTLNPGSEVSKVEATQ